MYVLVNMQANWGIFISAGKVPILNNFRAAQVKLIYLNPGVGETYTPHYDYKSSKTL